MTGRGPLLLGAGLTAMAGFVDVVGFFELNENYVSFMSGNTTQLGAGLVLPRLGDVPLVGCLLLLFVIGSTVGSLIALRLPERGASIVLLLVSAVLGFVLLAENTDMMGISAVAVAPFAMGGQNAAIRPAGAAKLGATYVTGTLFSVGSDLAGSLLGKTPRWRWLQHLTVWAALLLGAIIGARLHQSFGLYALLCPLTIYLVTGIVLALFPKVGRA